MVNPVNPNRASLPSINDPLVDAAGTATEEWYNFLLAMLVRTGGSEGTSTSDANSTANQAFQLAVTANNTANSALATANNANSSVGTATTLASTAESAATAAQAIANAACAKSANLSDLTNFATARSYLAVDVAPLSFSVAALTGQSIYQPIVRAVTIPAIFTCYSYAATPPSANAAFTLRVIRGGTGLVQTISTITLIAGSMTANSIVGSATTVNAGDTLQLQCPTSDAANVGLTIKATLY